MHYQLSALNYISLLVFCLSFLSTQPLAASDHQLESLLAMELEELLTITVVSKREETIENAPGIVTIISSEEIKKFGARNLHDVLNRQVNMQIIGSYIFPDNQVSLRAALNGLQDNQVLYLLNGRPLTNTQGEGVNMDLYFNFPIDVIEQIEIIRGPGSVLYGTNAFAGIINIKTQKASGSFSPLLSATLGSFDTKSTQLIGGKSLDELSFIAAVQATDFNGDNSIDYQDAFGNFNSYPSGGSGLSVVSSAEYKQLDINLYLGQTTRNNFGVVILFPEQETTVKRITFDIGHSIDIHPDWILKTNYAFYQDFLDLNSNFDLINNPGGFNTELSSNLYSFELNLFGNIAKNTNLLVGLNPHYTEGEFDEGALKGQWNTWQASTYA